MRGRMSGMERVTAVLFGLFGLGFWLPPLIAGVWMAGRRQRLLNISLVALAWPLVWLVTNLFLLQRLPKGRSPDGQGFMAVGLIVWAFSMVPAGSAVACWIETRWRSWRFSLRTLLIATTLAGVVLGLIVRLAR
jgi:hypothetical protein